MSHSLFILYCDHDCSCLTVCRESDEDYLNLGDYETMRGQIGDEDDVVDEFKEDEEHEVERQEADLTFRWVWNKYFGTVNLYIRYYA